MKATKTTARRKLYLIGIDAAPLWLLRELKGRSGMEPFSKLLDSGQIGNLESTLPPMSGCSWPTIYTGLTPGEHGAPDFFVMKKDYVKDVVYYDSKAAPPFWKELAERGHRCLVITPCMEILLPDYGNVDLITGFPLKSRANGEKLRNLMLNYHFDGEPDIEKSITDGKITEMEASRQYVKSVNKRARIARSMIETGDYDFVYVCFTETDRLQHFTLNKPNKFDYILPVYAEIAKFIDYVEKRAEKENALVMLISDHGAQPIHQKFLLNAWLIRNGYAALKESVMKSIMSTDEEAPSSYSIRERIMRSRLRKVYDRMPHHVKRVTAGLVGGIFSKASAGTYTRLHLFDFDMKRTKAFAEVSNDPVGTLWINDKRFVNGTVKDSEKKRLKEEIMRKLSRVKSRDGERIVVGYEDAIKYYGGTRKFIPADLFIEAKKGYTIDIFNFSTSTYFMKPEKAKSGDHIMHGIVGYFSNGTRLKLDGANVLDIAPTIRDYFGVNRSGKRSLLERQGMN